MAKIFNTDITGGVDARAASLAGFVVSDNIAVVVDVDKTSISSSIWNATNTDKEAVDVDILDRAIIIGNLDTFEFITAVNLSDVAV